MAKTKSVIVLLLLFCLVHANSQNYRFGYLVEFTDKLNSAYSTDRPHQFLSERAINRKNKLGIEISEHDFPVNQFYTDSLLKFEGNLHTTSRWFNSAVFLTDNPQFLSLVQQCSFVKSSSLVYENTSAKGQNSNNKWSLYDAEKINYGQSYNQIAMCNAHKLYEKGFRGEGIHIAVLDAGFFNVNELSCFDSLRNEGRILSTWDFVEGNNNVFDDHTHGMAVLSILTGNVPDQLMGTAPKAFYHLFRTENAPTEYLIEEENWIAGAEAADSAGVDIITASLGYSTYDNPDMSHTYAAMDGKSTRITQCAEIAFEKGIFVVNSAGNSGNDSWRYITAPSDGENVLSVGAVDAEQVIAGFSSRGPSYDGRTKPDVMAKGVATTIINANDEVSRGNGTSFSGPVITGMVACLWQALPEYTNKQLLDLIRSYGDRYSNPSNNYGFGIPDFGKALFLLDSANYEHTEFNSLVKLYPNPFKNSFSFHLYVNEDQKVEISLINTQGQKVIDEYKQLKAQSYNIIKLDAAEKLNTGFYILSIKTNQQIITQTILKQ